MTHRAFHTAAVFLPVLMADQADVPTPLGQSGLIRSRVTRRAGRHVGQLGHMVLLRIVRVAKAAVGGGNMV